jgi:hypothetical protein
MAEAVEPRPEEIRDRIQWAVRQAFHELKKRPTEIDLLPGGVINWLQSDVVAPTPIDLIYRGSGGDVVGQVWVVTDHTKGDGDYVIVYNPETDSFGLAKEIMESRRPENSPVGTFVHIADSGSLLEAARGR